MISFIDCLRSDPKDSAGRRFEVWRVKNTHHIDFARNSGYRDVKLLGKFSSRAQGEELSMAVEIQVIDCEFLAIKKLEHRLYAITRGDFW